MNTCPPVVSVSSPLRVAAAVALVVALVAGGGVGCVFGGPAVVAPREFELPSPPAAMLDVQRAPLTDRVLLFAEVYAPVRLDERLVIVLGDTGERRVLEGASWADRPERLLSERVRQRLRGAGIFRGIVRRPVGERYLELRCLLLAFDVVRHEGENHVRVALDAYLVDTRDGTFVWNGLMTAEQKATSLEAERVVAAFGLAIEDICVELARHLEAAVRPASGG